MPITRARLGAAALLALVLAGCAGAPPAGPAPSTAVPGTAVPGTAAAEATATGTPAAPRCTLDHLRATLGRTTGEAGQRHTAVVWTNSSTTACTVAGFGGVDLVGPDDPLLGPTYSLPRSAGEPARIRLEPGATAHTTITWLPPQDGPGWTPTGMLVTPPDETRSARLDWPGGAVLRQDGATHPGTFIDPVRPGSEG